MQIEVYILKCYAVCSDIRLIAQDSIDHKEVKINYSKTDNRANDNCHWTHVIYIITNISNNSVFFYLAMK